MKRFNLSQVAQSSGNGRLVHAIVEFLSLFFAGLLAGEELLFSGFAAW